MLEFKKMSNGENDGRDGYFGSEVDSSGVSETVTPEESCAGHDSLEEQRQKLPSGENDQGSDLFGIRVDGSGAAKIVTSAKSHEDQNGPEELSQQGKEPPIDVDPPPNNNPKSKCKEHGESHQAQSQNTDPESVTGGGQQGPGNGEPPIHVDPPPSSTPKEECEIQTQRKTAI